MDPEVEKVTSDDDESARQELRRILASASFEVSERNRQFLSHVVEETLAGRASRIKAYSIATQVFGRGDDFDPIQDSIVRIEASRLRRALEHFYLKEGETPGVRILIPKGTYVPEFQAVERPGAKNPSPPQASTVLPPHSRGPRILVCNFEQDGDLDRYPTIGRQLTRQVISALTKFYEIFVYGFETSDQQGDGARSGAHAAALDVDYKLFGTVTISSKALSVELLLQNVHDCRFVWAYSVERPIGGAPEPAQHLSLGAEIADHLARIIAERDGVIDSQARDSAGNPPQHFAGYQKILEFHDYWRSLDPSLFEPLRRDLEATVATDPHFATAFTCLSLMYSNAARYGYDLGPECRTPLERAMDLAKKAIYLAPNSSRAYHARAIAEWFSGMPLVSIATLKIARALNPNDSEIMAELGFRHAMRMEWSLANPLIEQSYERNPLQPASYRMGMFFYHFAEGRYERALSEAIATQAPTVPYVHIAAAAALSGIGRFDEASDRLDEAERLKPNLLRSLRADLTSRQIHPDLVDAIVGAIDRIRPSTSAGSKRTA
ncbi:hypothetical protein H0I76_13045 [Limibaculum sp. M0105]|uniref:TolB amino-terminal domain-containing protein n=1 Tax=Thermohalobaculum xanthum TaxID=2753746 RepID=A0A8J7M9V9_9RHOB|nr:hypothetical protein [Thermohalobaculum xanthum]MBK0400119.1 hypothetical protein [Thermohalobaculum xanthum]